MTTPTNRFQLSASEREILALLAAGHTAKSIAALTGRSVNSINERLRDARRKTGAGSSRELARLLAANDGADKLIGVASPCASAEVRAPLANSVDGRRARTIAMMSATAAFAVVFAATIAGPAHDRTPDPVLDRPVADFMVPSDKPGSPREWYERLRSERRSAYWAKLAEAELRKRYANVPGVLPDQVRVTCRQTLCEVAALQRIATPDDAAAMEALGERLGGFRVMLTAQTNLTVGTAFMRNLIYLRRKEQR